MTPTTRAVHVTLWEPDPDRLLTDAVVTLAVDGVSLPCVVRDDGGYRCELRPETPAPYGAEIRATKDGYQPFTHYIELTGAALQDITVPPLRLTRLAPPTPRLRVQGRDLVTEDGRPFRWRFATGFRLLDWIADGNEAQTVAYLDWLKAEGFNGARVLTSLCCWFELSLSEGQRVAPRALELAAQRGLYLELVGLAGTQDSAPSLDAMRQHLQALGAICQQHTNCAGIEVGNEINHPSQSQTLKDHQPALLQALFAAAPGVPVSGGSNCCGQTDEGSIYGGSYLTVHRDRSRDLWNRVRRVKELGDLSERAWTYVVDDEATGADETDRGGDRSAAAEEFYAQGALSRIVSVGATFHFEAGLQAQVPPDGSRQRESARAFIEGTQIAPDHESLVFRNAGWTGALESPITSATGAIRVYSGLVQGQETRAYTVALGVDPGYVLDLRAPWRVVRVIAARPGVSVYELAK